MVFDPSTGTNARLREGVNSMPWEPYLYLSRMINPEKRTKDDEHTNATLVLSALGSSPGGTKRISCIFSPIPPLFLSIRWDSPVGPPTEYARV